MSLKDMGMIDSMATVLVVVIETNTPSMDFVEPWRYLCPQTVEIDHEM